LGGGDLTEIGEKGVNLSGGQKQRVSIARALYSNSDIYLLDDCLSSLDAYIGKNIFFNVLKEYLQKNGKTIVFVTNAIDYTEHTDRVLVMENGKIIEDGAPQKLGSKADSAFKKLKLKYQDSQHQHEDMGKKEEQEAEDKKERTIEIFGEEEEKLGEEKKQKAKGELKKKELQGLVRVEERLKGSVPWRLYYRFFTGPGPFATFLMFFFILLAQAARVASDWWLGEWGSGGFHIA
jgi:ABC-type multidrug transport system ATPase subunit